MRELPVLDSAVLVGVGFIDENLELFVLAISGVLDLDLDLELFELAGLLDHERSFEDLTILVGI